MNLDAARFIRRGNAFVAADLHAEEFLQAVPDGGTINLQQSVEEASPEHQKWFRALINKAHENLPEKYADQFPTVDSLTDAIKIACGHFRWQHLTMFGDEPDVERRYQMPLTLKGMSKDKFKEFTDLAVGVLSRMIGVDVTTLIKEADAERKPRPRR